MDDCEGLSHTRWECKDQVVGVSQRHRETFICYFTDMPMRRSAEMERKGKGRLNQLYQPL